MNLEQPLILVLICMGIPLSILFVLALVLIVIMVLQKNKSNGLFDLKKLIEKVRNWAKLHSISFSSRLTSQQPVEADLKSQLTNVSEEGHLRMLKKVHELEEQVETLKSYVKKPPATLRQKTQKVFNYCLNNWTLLSFICTIFIALYIQFAFGVDYFESFREISTTKKLSEFYRTLGDVLIEKMELDAAKEAYNQALEIDKNNTLAFYGLAKSQVFDPVEGKKYSVPEVVDAKLNYLLSQFPEDYQLYFLKGQLYYFRQDIENAKLWMEKSIEKNPKFAAGYIFLGFMRQGADIEEAAQYMEKALEIDPDNSIANNNLGFYHMLLTDFKKATNYLEKAYKLSPFLITAVSLGDAALYSNEIDRAKIYYLTALEAIEKPDIENERYIGGEWLYNSMPLQVGDTETIKNWAKFITVDNKRILIYYNLSFCYALSEDDLDKATETFEKAVELDKLRIYDSFFAYKMISIESFVTMSRDKHQWFDTHRSILTSKN